MLNLLRKSALLLLILSRAISQQLHSNSRMGMSPSMTPTIKYRIST